MSVNNGLLAPLQPVEETDGRLGGVGVPDEGQQEAAAVEIHGRQELRTPAAPLHTVDIPIHGPLAADELAVVRREDMAFSPAGMFFRESS